MQRLQLLLMMGAIYFQTVTYPEVLFIEWLLMGMVKVKYVVCLWIVQSEDKITIPNLSVEFKKHNESSSVLFKFNR